jgi:hypothetical protein
MTDSPPAANVDIYGTPLKPGMIMNSWLTSNWMEFYPDIGFYSRSQEAYMVNTAYFSYPGDAPGPRRMHTGTACFRYPVEVPPGPRQMHTGSACFRYPGEVPPGPRQMHTGSVCFKY